jgi:DNA polymerase-3 subunit delta'
MLFSDVIGQKETKATLLRAAAEGRISHAQLFLGPEGSGALPLALAYAQYLVCERRTDADACGTCPACIKSGKMVHPDITFSFPMAPNAKEKKKICLDYVPEFRAAVLENPYLSFNDWVTAMDAENKQGSIHTDEAADIVRRLSLRSAEGGYKICILWFPEALNASAANKLLKIVEEPPEQTLFLLVAARHEQILATIRSRTQLVKLYSITDAEMTEALVRLHRLSPDDARRIAHRSGGDYNEALRGMNEAGDNDGALFLEWMRTCLKLRVAEISRFSDEMASLSRERQKVFLQQALHIARECLLMNYGHASMIRFSEEEQEQFRRFAPFVNRNNAASFIDEINKAHFHLERNANARLLFTDLSFAMNKILQVK